MGATINNKTTEQPHKNGQQSQSLCVCVCVCVWGGGLLVLNLRPRLWRTSNRTIVPTIVT